MELVSKTTRQKTNPESRRLGIPHRYAATAATEQSRVGIATILFRTYHWETARLNHVNRKKGF